MQERFNRILRNRRLTLYGDFCIIKKKITMAFGGEYGVIRYYRPAVRRGVRAAPCLAFYDLPQNREPETVPSHQPVYPLPV